MFTQKSRKKPKIGLLLKSKISFPSITVSSKAKKIVPLYIESDSKKFERNQINKHFVVFRNERNKNYSNTYMDEVTDLLFKNEGSYWTKRNLLMTPKNPLRNSSKFRKPNFSQDEPTISVTIRSPLTPKEKGKKIRKITSPKSSNKGVYFTKQYLKMNSNQEFLSPSKRKNDETIRFCNMVHLSDKAEKIYSRNFKNSLIRRVDGVKTKLTIDPKTSLTEAINFSPDKKIKK